MSQPTGAYGADNDIVDYILGITFEIWESRGVELIHQYYGEDCVVYGLDGITRGASAVVDATWATLAAFPDRNLVAEQVLWSKEGDGACYTSHRLLSTGTNRGPTQFGPATGERIRMTNIADCVVENGVITREWLVRDSLTLARQLGADLRRVGEQMATARTAEHAQWLRAEHERVQAGAGAAAANDTVNFAARALGAAFSGNRAEFEACYAPYAMLRRNPLTHFAGRDAIFAHYAEISRVLGDPAISIDHIAVQPAGEHYDIAVRWTAAGTHAAPLHGVDPTQRPLFLLGVTHWHCIAGRIAGESTVFDELALLSQAV